MNNDIFRFVVSRPAQKATGSKIENDRRMLAYKRAGLTKFAESVSKTTDPAEAVKISREYLTRSSKPENSHRHPDNAAIDLQPTIDVLATKSLKELEKDFLTLSKNRSGSSNSNNGSDAKTESLEIHQLQKSSSGLKALESKSSELADTLLAKVIAGYGASYPNDEIVKKIRIVEILQRLLRDPESKVDVETIRRWLRAKVILPGIPLQRPFRVERDLASKKERDEQETSGRDDDQSRLRTRSLLQGDGESGKKVSKELDPEQLRETSRELLALASKIGRNENSPSSNSGSHAAPSIFWSRRPSPKEHSLPAPVSSWRNQLSSRGTATLNALNIDPQTTSLSEAVRRVQYQIKNQTSPEPLLRPRFSSTAMEISGFHGLPSPGNWPQHPSRSDVPAAPDTRVTVPQGIGKIGTKRRGDLFVIRQQLKRYEASEIAHIENILKGEDHERTYSTAQTTETILSTTEERDESNERDLQSTERFEMSSEMKELMKADLKLEAGVSASASYGPTIGVEVGSNMATELGAEKSKQSASQYSRELTSRAQNRLEIRVTQQRTTRAIQEVRELTRHGVNNTNGQGHTRGLYRWVNKVYQAQVVNYGMRDLYDFYVPEPAAFWRFIQSGSLADSVSLIEPVPPQIRKGGLQFVGSAIQYRDLVPSDLTEQNFALYVAQYGATDVSPPPEEFRFVSQVIEKGAPSGEDAYGPATKVATDFTVPDGYEAIGLGVSHIGIKLQDSDPFWKVEVLGRSYAGTDDFEEIDPTRGTIPIGLVSNDYWNLVVGVEFKCQRTQQTWEAWQLSTYSAIMLGYEKLRLAYEDKVKAANADRDLVIAGRNPAENEKLIRDELKKSVLTILTGQRFEAFDSMRYRSGQYPEIALPDAEEEGRYVAFWEQAFEWENMTFLFYPYFWGNKKQWPAIAQLNDTDPLFAQFLRAGFAHVQLPVRSDFQDVVDYTFAPENWSGNQWIGSDPPGFERDGALSVEEEMLFQTGGNTFVQGPGFVSLVTDSDMVAGTNTAFTADDVDRELRVKETDYRILDVISETQVRIGPSKPSSDVNQAIYALGPKLVGLPWEIIVPTTLVYLQDDAKLNP